MPADNVDTITVTTSGRVVFRFLNVGFVFSLLGGLQALVLILGLLVTCLLGATTSSKSQSLSTISGFTFYVIVLLVSFWCLLTTSFIYISCAVSTVTASLLPRTVFFLMYNAMAAMFYLISCITCLGETSGFSWLTSEGSDIKPMVITSAVLGIVAGAVYILITIVGIFVFRKMTVS